MSIDKFISTSKNLAPAGWKHPKHILDAVAAAKRDLKQKARQAPDQSSSDESTQKTQEGRTAGQYTADMDTKMLIELRKLGYTAAQAVFIIRNCGTGSGGFQPGNDCAKGKAGKDGDGDGEFEGGGSKGAGGGSADTKSRIDRREFDEIDKNDTKSVDALYKKAAAEQDRLGAMLDDANDEEFALNDDSRREADVESDEYKSWVADMKENERIRKEVAPAYDALRKRTESLKDFTSSGIAKEAARAEKSRQQKEAKEAARKKQEELDKQPKVKAPRKPRGPRTAARVAEEIKEVEDLERLTKVLGFKIVDDEGKEVRDPAVVKQLKDLKREQKELERQEKKAAKEKAKTSAKKRSFTHRLIELRRTGIPAAVAIRMARGDDD